jgi:hypothetical protein
MPPRTAPDADDPLHLRTAWHPLLILLLERLLPHELWDVLSEFTLTREPRRIDAVIVRRVAAQAWRASHLHSVLDDLHDHNLVHFKGATDALERADALQVLSYAYQYMALRDLRSPAVMSLRVVAPTLTPRFREQLTALGGALVESEARGVHVGHLHGFALRVVETSVAWSTPGERLLYAISPACLTEPERPRGFDDTERDVYYRLLQGITQLSQDLRWKAIMKDATLVGETASQALMDLLAILPPEVRLAGVGPEDLAVLPPEQRLAGLAPEQRLAGLAPEQRLAGLAPEQRLAGLAPEQRLAGLAPEQRLAGLSEADRVLALPDAALRALPAEYLATLPADAQARICARLGR